jgi:F-box-like
MLDELPPELLATIVSYLDFSELAKYVTVSRPWQYAIERPRFRNIHLESTDLLAFPNTLVDHRPAALTELS